MSYPVTAILFHQMRPRQVSRRPVMRAPLVALGVLALAATLMMTLVACGGTTSGGSNNPTSGAEAGRIVVQLFYTPGFVYPPINGVPEWTLYGDGTLVFQSAASPAPGQTSLVSVHLTSAQVAHILDVVVNQRHFFASNQLLYGRPIPDAGLTLLYVSSNGQRKMVQVGDINGATNDAQTENVFAIVQYLRGYMPAGAQAYVPATIALIAIAQGQATRGEAPWPYGDVALATVANRECSLFGWPTCSTANPVGVTTIPGARGVDLLRRSGARGYFAQGGKSYFVSLWPLTPDALHPQTGQRAAVRVAKAGGAIASWPLLAG